MADKKKILVVDDAEELTKAMQDILTFKGYETLTAKNGKEALQIALAEHPDLIVLDLRMPDMDGYETVRVLRRDPWGKDAKILILTATDFLNERPTDLGLKPTDYLSKSVWGIGDVEAQIAKKLNE